MLIDNVVSLTFGVLQNSPNVRDCYDIAFKSSDVRRGDLFVVNDENSIDEAIMNGAYALLYDCDMSISDNEIAWIKVDNIDAAVTKILRHQLLNYHGEIISGDTVFVNIIQTLCSDERLVVLNTADLETIYKIIQKLSRDSILLLDEQLLSSTIFPTCKSYQNSRKQHITLVKSSLFKSSFLFNGIYYEQQRISPLLIPYLESCLDFFKFKNLNYALCKVALIEHFVPIFVNNALKIREFGATERVVVFESETRLFEKAVLFFKKHASWSQIIIFIPNNSNIIKYDTLEYKLFNSSEDIIKQLQTRTFNFALVHHDSSIGEQFGEVEKAKQLLFEL